MKKVINLVIKYSPLMGFLLMSLGFVLFVVGIEQLQEVKTMSL